MRLYNPSEGSDNRSYLQYQVSIHPSHNNGPHVFETLCVVRHIRHKKMFLSMRAHVQVHSVALNTFKKGQIIGLDVIAVFLCFALPISIFKNYWKEVSSSCSSKKKNSVCQLKSSYLVELRKFLVLCVVRPWRTGFVSVLHLVTWDVSEVYSTKGLAG